MATRTAISRATGVSPMVRRIWNHCSFLTDSDSTPEEARVFRPVLMKIRTSGRSSRPMMVRKRGGWDSASALAWPRISGTGRTSFLPVHRPYR